MLAKAKDDLDHGEFLAMVERDLPFGPRYAQMLMRVAEDPRLTNANHASHLPPSITSLYLLSRLDDLTFRRALSRGDISAEMERADAALLLSKTKRLAGQKAAAEQEVSGRVQLWSADPPWPTSYGRPYKTLPLDRIKNLRLAPNGKASSDLKHPSVAEASAQTAAIGMWAVDELLAEAEATLAAWGFGLVGRVIWDKGSHSRPGRATLMQHEFLLLGTRGAAVPVWKPRSVVTISKAGLRDSEKPEEFRAMLVKMFPLFVNRCELFARRRVEKWTPWGNQVPAE
ncbi:MAG: hypothetical protein K2Y71_29205 [Xanthobacteraceae bacterium]|nr:hypothetical protein [Xanthobacteraceae bacterium]